MWPKLSEPFRRGTNGRILSTDHGSMSAKSELETIIRTSSSVFNLNVERRFSVQQLGRSFLGSWYNTAPMAGVVTAVAAAGAAVASLRQFDGYQGLASSKVCLAPSRIGRTENVGDASERSFDKMGTLSSRRSSPNVLGIRAEIYIEEAETKTASLYIPTIQQAWLYSEYGPKENLSLGEVPVPELEADQVLIKVKAAALNPVDSKRRAGKFQKTDSALPTVPCYDCAGVVVKVGSAVTKFKVGDEVYGDTSEFCLDGPKQYGTLAQYAAAEEKLLALKPKKLSFSEAASLPLAIETAYQGLKKAGIKEGDKVFVLGGSGGVGTLAVQLAKQVFKASTVAATASTGKVDFVKSLGADVVIDYKQTKLEELTEKYDVAIDTVGKGEGPKVVKPDGGLVVLTGPVEPPGFRYVIVSNGSDLAELNPYFESGALKPVIDPKGLFPFSQVVEAFSYLEEGHSSGKVVISPIE
ncbi:hypothetical protein R1flu_003182 [Riccia fluitans]|uniref:Enoyl reductase (ER) domain-containing protein n=1 Tax=Riccia fluitans TaxID=41844 RepID=A0ABD1Y890_9MARC